MLYTLDLGHQHFGSKIASVQDIGSIFFSQSACPRNALKWMLLRLIPKSTAFLWEPAQLTGKRGPRTKEIFHLVFDHSKCITSCTWGVPAYWLIPCQVMGWTTASKWVTKLYTLQSACDNLPLYSYHGAYNWMEDIVECELNFSRAMLAADQINKQWEKAGQYFAKRLPLQIAQQFHDLKG